MWWPFVVVNIVSSCIVLLLDCSFLLLFCYFLSTGKSFSNILDIFNRKHTILHHSLVHLTTLPDYYQKYSPLHSIWTINLNSSAVDCVLFCFFLLLVPSGVLSNYKTKHIGRFIDGSWISNGSEWKMKWLLLNCPVYHMGYVGEMKKKKNNRSISWRKVQKPFTEKMIKREKIH